LGVSLHLIKALTRVQEGIPEPTNNYSMRGISFHINYCFLSANKLIFHFCRFPTIYLSIHFYWIAFYSCHLRSQINDHNLHHRYCVPSPIQITLQIPLYNIYPIIIPLHSIERLVSIYYNLAMAQTLISYWCLHFILFCIDFEMFEKLLFPFKFKIIVLCFDFGINTIGFI